MRELALCAAARVSRPSALGVSRRAGARGVATLLTGLVGVDFALGELAGADALVGGAVLLEAAVLCEVLVRISRGGGGMGRDGGGGNEVQKGWTYRWACTAGPPL
jgi:hypothetical protein